MKKLIIFLLSFCIWHKADAQNIIQYEYWYDSNYSTKTSVNNTPGVILDLNTSLTGTLGLTPGLHTMNYRAKDTDGKWSCTITEQFYATGNLNIEGYEYWFDDNYSNKIVNAVAPSQNFVLLSDLNTSAVGYGAHALNFRSRDSAGRWSIVVKEYFFKSVGGTQLSNAEYWIDSNYTNKQPISFTSSNIVFINQSILTSNLDDQLHTLNFRIQDQSGKWSTVTSSYFMVNSLIVSYDYWFDTDFEHKITTTVTPTSILSNEPDFNSGSLPTGTHIVNFRAKNSFGKYSTTISQTITVVVNPNSTYYADSDGDGYGNVSVMLVTNSQPSGYVLDATDCDDTNASVNPGATEIAYDGLDNNCDGHLDEGFPPISTRLNTALCGSTLLAITGSINAVPMALATDYRFRITNGANVQTIDRPVPWFFMTLLANYDYSTTYTVDVMLKVGGVWLGYYGDPCPVTTPDVAPVLLSISSPACGSTLATVSSTITSRGIVGATGYKFRITNGAEVQEFATSRPYFRMTNLPSYVYGTSYTIEVAVKSGASGVYTSYGPSCVLSTPAVPQLDQCGATLPSGSTASSAGLTGVTLYTYEITTPSGIVLRNKVAPNFQVNSIPGYSSGTSYSVRLAVTSTGVQSPWGAACTINPAPAARFGNSVNPSTGLVTEFKAVGAPNPFESNFTLSVTTASDAKVQIAVYDMIGKQLELKEVNATDATDIAVGANYPSGVYNVIVSQGENVKSLRMIKR